MSNFNLLQHQKRGSSAIPTPSFARSVRPFAPIPSPTSQTAQHDGRASLDHAGRFGHSFDRISLLSPEKKNETGLPDTLRVGIESISGLSMDDVKVHYNSSKPAQVKALAYTQGTNIHVGPGQERHLQHEAWHLVQQVQGRVKPTARVGEVAVNEEQALESEADAMGAKAGMAGQQLIQRQAMCCLQGSDIAGSRDRQRPIIHKLTRVAQPPAQQQVVQRTPETAIELATRLIKKQYQSWKEVEKDRDQFSQIEWAEVIQEYYRNTISQKIIEELSDNKKMYLLLTQLIKNSVTGEYALKHDVNWKEGTYTGGGQCELVAVELRKHYQNEIDAQVHKVGAEGTDHAFVVVKGPLDEQYQTIIDPTWKQFPMFILRNTINDQLNLNNLGAIQKGSILWRGRGILTKKAKETVQADADEYVFKLVEFAAMGFNELPHVFVGSFADLSMTMQKALELAVRYYLESLLPEGIIKSSLKLDLTQMREALLHVIKGIYIGTREKKHVRGGDNVPGGDIRTQWESSQIYL